MPMLESGVDTLVLGCTHYPLLKESIARVTGPEVALVDSAETCAAFVQRNCNGIICWPPKERGVRIM